MKGVEMNNWARRHPQGTSHCHLHDRPRTMSLRFGTSSQVTWSNNKNQSTPKCSPCGWVGERWGFHVQYTEVLTAAESTNELVETAHGGLMHICSTLPWVLYRDLTQRTQPQTKTSAPWGKAEQSLGTWCLTEMSHSPACVAPGKWEVTCCQQLWANKTVHTAAVTWMVLRRDEFLPLTIANGLQAGWQLQSTQFSAVVQLTRHLWDCTWSLWRKEAEQVCFNLFLYCRSICFSPQLARPGAQLRSLQQKPLYWSMGTPHHYQHHVDWIAQGEAILGTTGGFSILLSTGMEPADASPQSQAAIPSR